MINSNKRKLCLSGWLKDNYYSSYESPVKLQFFLLFYESFSKINGEKADFTYLKGDKKGPVFSQVWGDYTKERQSFDRATDISYTYNAASEINDELAQKSAFLVRTLSDTELSELSHKMNIWKVKENFNKDDKKMMELLNAMYPLQLIKQSDVISINNYFFVIKKSDFPRLTEEHYDILSSLTENLFIKSDRLVRN